MNNNPDQRQEFRLDNQLTVILEINSSANGEPTLVITKSLDISANGLRVISTEAIETDIILRCCIRPADDSRQFLLVTEVKWCRPQADGDYLLGLSLFDSEGTDIVAWKEFIVEVCGLN